MTQKRYTRFIIATVLSATTASAHIFMNVTRPHEWLIENQERGVHKRFLMNFLFEHGFNAHGFNSNHEKANVARAWNADQDALKMLEGFPSSSDIGLLRTKLDGLDDNVRGHFDVCADLKLNYLVGIGTVFYLPHNFSIGVSLPFYGTELKNVVWKEQTLDLTADDALVKTNLTNDFFSNVETLGGLDLQGWKADGVGDMTVLAMWQQNFAQQRPILKNVRLDARTGFSLPTGRRVDEDKILSVPFGNDGAVGIIWGGGLTATLSCYFKLGFDVELMHLFGNSRCRRIKTHMDQTELLLLAKVKAYKSWGLTQRFNVFARIQDVIPGLSAGALYQFLKRGDDTLTLCSLDFADSTANSANMIQERSVQSIIFDATYDAQAHMDPCASMIPYFSLFYRMPFRGENVIATHSLGIGMGVRF